MLSFEVASPAQRDCDNKEEFKMKKVTAALLLAMVLTTTTVVSVYAAVDGLQFTIVDGVEVVSASHVAGHLDLDFEWDRTTQTITFTDLDGNVESVVIYDVGGFYDGRTVWFPMDIMTEAIYITVYTEYTEVELADVSRILDREPVVRTTDHGEIAVAFIAEMNDNLYNRVPFSYRELDAAEWIVDELLAMGFGEDAIVMQGFSINYLEEFEAGFRADWFTEVVYRRVNDVELVPEEFIEEWADSIYQQTIINFAEAGFTYDMIAYDLGMELTEFIEMFTIPALGDLFDMYGAFSEMVDFRQYSQNIILTIPGRSEQKIVITAHYDSVYNTPGASDNASGVGLLLESAYRMMGVDNYFTLVYAFVGAEEVGLIGTFYYYENLGAAQQSNILVNINADVLFEGPYFFVGLAQVQEALVGLSRNEVVWYAMAGYGLMESEVTYKSSQLAHWLNEEYGLQLIVHRELAAMPSDQLVFLVNGHSVIALTGLARYGDEAYLGFNFEVSPFVAHNGDYFGASFVHTIYDDVHFINENWPDKIANAMWTFSLFLETLLTAEF